LLILGSLCIAYNVFTACHELGHAFAMMLDGGYIEKFVLNPFSWSSSLGQDLNNPLFTAWGRVTFGLSFAARLVVLCCGITPYLLMILLYNLLFNSE
jgi:hypothetical protein